MAATMVIDPRPDGWEIINADDFSNAGSSGRVASFIEKIEGISPQKTLDDAARTIGASDWVTVDDLDDDILESRKSALSPFDVGDDEYESYSSDEDVYANTTDRKGDSLTTASSGMYTFWGNRPISAPPVNNAYEMFYGIEDDRNRSIHCQGWRIDDPGPDYGRCQVIVKTPDKMTLETAVVTRWNDAKQWFMDYCTNNQSYVDGILDSVNGVFASQNVNHPVDLGADYLNPYSFRDFANKRSNNQSEVNNMRNKASIRKADGDWAYWGESDNGTSKEYYYGEIDNENNSVMLYTEDQDPSNGLDCRVVAPDGDIITTFTAPTWEDAKAYFDSVRVDYDNFDGYVFTLYDWENRDTANRNKGASMNRKKAYNQDFSIWGEDINIWGENTIENSANQFSAYINYGEDGDENNSVTMYADGDNGPNGEMSAYVVENQYGDTINSFVASSWEDAKDQFESQCNLSGMYDKYLVTQEEEFNHLNGIGASRKRASVENSNGHVFDDSDWDAIVQNMDPDIREQLSENLAPCSNQEFFDAYADAYYNKYGEEWELDKADPQW